MGRGPVKGTLVKELLREPKKALARLTKSGREIVDGQPLEPPLGYKRSPTLAEQIKSMVRGAQLAEDAKRQGYETFEEADDFDLEDEFDPQSPYEEYFDPAVDNSEDVLSKAVARGMEEYNTRLEERAKRKDKKKDKEGVDENSSRIDSDDAKSVQPGSGDKSGKRSTT